MLDLRSSSLPHDVLRRLELEGRVVDVEVIGETHTQVIEDSTGICVRPKYDMGRDNVHPIGDRPRVEVMDRLDTRSLKHMLADIG